MMKRLLLVVLTAVFLFISPSVGGEVYTRSSVSQNKDVTVYITRTGAKYHTGYCRYLRQSKIAIGKKKAIAAGYGACSVCNP